jgi:hypothetical protein
VKRLAAEHQMKMLCIAVAIVVPLICLVLVGQAVRDARTPQTTIALDGSGVMHIGPLESLNPDAALFREISLQIAQTHFNRNPKGLDAAEMAERLYTSESLKNLQDEVAAEASLMERRNYFQQVQVVEIEPLDKGDLKQKPKYRIKGYIVRNGIVDGISQRESPMYFRLTVELDQNPDFGVRGQYPYKVNRYKLSWTNSRFERLEATDGAEASK